MSDAARLAAGTVEAVIARLAAEVDKGRDGPATVMLTLREARQVVDMAARLVEVERERDEARAQGESDARMIDEGARSLELLMAARIDRAEARCRALEAALREIEAQIAAIG